GRSGPDAGRRGHYPPDSGTCRGNAGTGAITTGLNAGTGAITPGLNAGTGAITPGLNAGTDGAAPLLKDRHRGKQPVPENVISFYGRTAPGCVQPTRSHVLQQSGAAGVRSVRW